MVTKTLVKSQPVDCWSVFDQFNENNTKLGLDKYEI